MTAVDRIAVYGRMLFAKRARVLGTSMAMIFGAYLAGPLWGQFQQTCPGGGNGYCSTASIGIGPAASTPSYINFMALGTSQLGNLLGLSSSTANWLPWVDGNDAIQLIAGAAFGVAVQPTGNNPYANIFYVSANVAGGGGSVGVGTVHPTCGGSQPCLLSVNGVIGAKEIVVTNSIGADYVFDPDYRLRPLQEVAAYIQEHHHLPDIPSAATVKETGLSVGDMQTKLLAKIEELTLHLIRADEKNRELQERIARLEAGTH